MPVQRLRGPRTRSTDRFLSPPTSVTIDVLTRCCVCVPCVLGAFAFACLLCTTLEFSGKTFAGIQVHWNSKIRYVTTVNHSLTSVTLVYYRCYGPPPHPPSRLTHHWLCCGYYVRYINGFISITGKHNLLTRSALYPQTTNSIRIHN